MLKSKTDMFGKAMAVGAGLQKQEQLVRTVLANANESRLRIDEIRPRHHPATRRLDPRHVLELAESISALGLIEPLVLDSANRLLAGGHRWAALRLIAGSPELRPGVWREMLREPPSSLIESRLSAIPTLSGLVSVHILPVDSVANPGMALAIEITENERRRSYTKEEVRGLAVTLRAAGYRDGVGRPKSGERTVVPALAAVLGRSRRSVYMMLAEDATTGEVPMKGADAAVDVADKRLKSALNRWLKLSRSDAKARGMAEALLCQLSESASGMV